MILFIFLLIFLLALFVLLLFCCLAAGNDPETRKRSDQEQLEFLSWWKATHKHK